MAHPELLLENQICFRVYALEKEILSAYRPHLDVLGLTYPQYLAMLVLWEKRRATVGEVCEALGLDTGTVSPLLKRIEAMGLVERQRDPEDERTVRVSLTASGKALEEEARKVPAALASCLFQGEGEDAAENYGRLKDALDAALAKLRSRACQGEAAQPRLAHSS